MNRRKFFKNAAVAGGATAVAASTFPAPAIAQNRIEIAMVTTWPRDFPGLGTGAQRFAKRLTDMTDGRMQVKYYAAGERVKPFDSFGEVASGNAQMYHAADYYWKGKHPGWAYFTAVPFGYVFSEINAWINFGGGQEWYEFKMQRFNCPPIKDEAWKRLVLTQPSAIKIVSDFARKINAVKYFDAGDVQANGFQIVEDDSPSETYTESGASYMGFAPSALAASALADQPQYGICFCGDGSFMMNPQILIDAVELGVKGMIVIFDNRRMSAITGLQEAQYGAGFKTNDSVEIDYVSMANAVKGVEAFFGGESTSELKSALEKAYTHQGLSVIHVPVYYGDNPLGGMGAYGSWNVGNWCESVQERYHTQIL